MNLSTLIFGERRPWQVAALFDDEQEARRSAEAVQTEEQLEPEEVVVFRPSDAQAPGKLNPRRRSVGIARTLVRAHLVLGAVGAVVGLVVALAVLASGFGAFTGSPIYSTALVTLLGLIGGLLLGGLVSLRPDQDVLRYRLEEAMADGDRWAVVVRARDHGEETRAGRSLRAHDGELIAAL